MKIQHLELEELLNQYGSNGEVYKMLSGQYNGSVTIGNTNLQANVSFDHSDNLKYCSISPVNDFECEDVYLLHLGQQKVSSFEEVKKQLDAASKLVATKVVFSEKTLRWADRFHDLISKKVDGCVLDVRRTGPRSSVETFSVQPASKQGNELYFSYSSDTHEMHLSMSRSISIAPPDCKYVRDMGSLPPSHQHLAQKFIRFDFPVIDDLEEALTLVDSLIPNLK